MIQTEQVSQDLGDVLRNLDVESMTAAEIDSALIANEQARSGLLSEFAKYRKAKLAQIAGLRQERRENRQALGHMKAEMRARRQVLRQMQQLIDIQVDESIEFNQ